MFPQQKIVGEEKGPYLRVTPAATYTYQIEILEKEEMSNENRRSASAAKGTYKVAGRH